MDQKHIEKQNLEDRKKEHKTEKELSEALCAVLHWNPRRGKWAKVIFEVIMAANIQELIKDTTLSVWEFQGIMENNRNSHIDTVCWKY